MSMNDFLVGLENTGISIFIRESSSFLGFPTILTAHAFGYCFIVATNAIVSARMLGFATSIPFKPLRRLFPVMWIGLILTTITGVLYRLRRLRTGRSGIVAADGYLSRLSARNLHLRSNSLTRFSSSAILSWWL